MGDLITLNFSRATTGSGWLVIYKTLRSVPSCRHGGHGDKSREKIRLAAQKSPSTMIKYLIG